MSKSNDKLKQLRELAAKLGPQFLKELQATKKLYEHQTVVNIGARTPTREDLHILTTLNARHLAESRKTLEIIRQMEDLVRLKKPPRAFDRNV